MKLEGKVALITGSDSGIGQATAIEFAKEGAGIVITYHTDKEGAEKTLKGVEKAGRKGIVLQVDVAEEQQVEQMFNKALEEFKTIDILMNNAGIDSQGIKVEDLPSEKWHKTLRTNLDGYFFCARRFINIRKKNGEKEK
jgi:glucose 1-dehydrogenase